MPAADESVRDVYKRVAVILLTLNQRDKTLRCLESLRPARSEHVHVLVWDNGSSDGTARAVEAMFADINVHGSPLNLGVASGRNRAAAIAAEKWSPEYLLFLDNDMTVDPNFIRELIRPFETNPRIGLTTGKILVLDDERLIYGAGGCMVEFRSAATGHVGFGEIDRGQYDEQRECIPSGGCLLIRTELFEALGGFDSLFDPYGPEDLDLGLRARRAGYLGWYVPSAVVYHEAEPGYTVQGGMTSPAYVRNKARKWMILFRRHATIREKLFFYVLGGPRMVFRMVLRELRRGNIAPVRALLGRAVH